MKSFWDTLLENRQWVFSGIGVFVLSGIVWTFRRFFGKSKPSTETKTIGLIHSAANSSPIAVGGVVHQTISYGNSGPDRAPTPDYRNVPTPIEIIDRIEQLPILERPNAGKSYEGIAVEWAVELVHLERDRTDQRYCVLAMDFRQEKPRRRLARIYCRRIDLSSYPRLKTALPGQKLVVRALIHELDELGMIEISDAQLSFPLESPQIASKIVHEVRFDYLPQSPLENGWFKVSDGDENPKFSRYHEFSGGFSMQTDGKVFAMDYRIPGAAREANSVQFDGELRPGAIFYVEVEVLNKTDGPGVETWWLAHVVGDRERIPEKETGREWKFFISPEPNGRGTEFLVNLEQEVGQALGSGKRFRGISRLRLRGDMSLSPIRIVICS